MNNNQGPALALKDIKFSYAPYNKDQTPLLDIPNLTIQKGEKIFIFGPSGSGKSTLLNIMTGILNPIEGDLWALGKNLTQMSSFKRDIFRGVHMGYIFQNFNLIPYLSVKDNILLSCKLHKERKNKAGPIEKTLHELCDTLGITQDLDKKAYQMSLGGQQRVAAARALLGVPEIIIADEPTSSLDEDRTSGFLTKLIELSDKHKSSLIFVSHDSRLKKYFDRSLSLEELQSQGDKN